MNYISSAKKRLLLSIAKRRRPFCDSVRIWCLERNAICQDIYDRQFVDRTFPLTIEPLTGNDFLELLRLNKRLPGAREASPDNFFRKVMTYEVPQKYMACVSGASIVGENGLIVLPDGSYVTELTFGYRQVLHSPGYYKFLLPRSQRKSGKFFSLMMHWANSGNIYHWLHDNLLRLYLVIDKLPEDITFIVPGKLTALQRDSLQAIGIQEKQLLFFHGDERWELESLYFAPPTTASGDDLPEANQWLKNLILQSYGVNPLNKGERIFIKRSSAAYRRIVNERDVEQCLEEYGFKAYALEDYSFREQVTLFAGAEMVVANHGAGLTNLLFSPVRTKVLEIFEPAGVRHSYWSLCNSLGHTYWYLLGRTEPNPTFSARPNIFIPIEKLKQALNQTLN